MDARTQRRLEGLAVERGARGFSFDDLAQAVVESGAGAREVADWLAEARASGYLADLEPEMLSDGTVLGPQRFCLAAALAREPEGGSGHTSDRRYADCDAPAR